VAPLAALAAVVVPEVLMTQGEADRHLADARWPAALAAACSTSGAAASSGTMLAGMAVFLCSSLDSDAFGNGCIMNILRFPI
jgi:branched-subunit amino acid transport protein